MELISFINSDPTIKSIYEKKFDFDLLEWQVTLKLAAVRLAFHKWIDFKAQEAISELSSPKI